MRGIFRKTMGVLATVGVAASVVAYLWSFRGLEPGPAKDAHPWIFLFFSGIVLLYVPVVISEYDGPLPQETFAERFAMGRPSWSVGVVKACGFFALGHFLLSLWLTRGGSPEIVDGQFVLRGHGMISHEQYVRIQAWEMRFMASFWMLAYLLLALYWWFPRARKARGPYD